MSYEFFEKIIHQIGSMGVSSLSLTPCTGDIFMDKNIIKKLNFLEKFPQIKQYGFFTNFILPGKKEIKELLDKNKFSTFAISIYGHDLSSFKKLSNGNENSYNRLVNNLSLLHDLLIMSKEKKFIWIGIRSYDFLQHSTIFNNSNSLLDIIKKLEENCDARIDALSNYNNWGGLLDKEKLSSIGINIIDGNLVYHKGACARIFYSVQIMADGRVNACSCRDANVTLCIGDLKKNHLSYILSGENPLYMNLIKAQESNNFPKVCVNCDFYQSIYKKHDSFDSIQKVYTKKEALKILEEA